MALSAPPAPVGAVAHIAVAGLGPLCVEIDGRPVLFRTGRRERGVFQELERLAAAARVRRRAGDIEGAAAHLRSGVALYEGDLFEDDRYEAWIDPFRRDLADTHLATITDLAEPMRIVVVRCAIAASIGKTDGK